METAGVIQETYNIWSWLLPLISGAIGALIGTYGGSYFLHWKQEKKIQNVRSMAIKALGIFKEYAQHKKIMLIQQMSSIQNLIFQKRELLSLPCTNLEFHLKFQQKILLILKA
nr:hypothetical protein [Bacteroides fragilis]MDA1487283.1 hypothetical protein [Bacteroides fragilis]